MPLTFSAQVAEWSAFYTTLAAVAATFAGLLFVSLSIRFAELSSARHADLRRLARHTFGCYLYLVVFSLVILIPGQVPNGVGVPLLIIGTMAMVQTAVQMRAAAREGSRRTALFRLSIANYAVLIAVALALMTGRALALYLLVTLTIWQLAWATRMSWDLLFIDPEA
ncbi:MAG TPA: hypothetical protein VNT81_08765 [Vicinamibacterales bacterium]|nr:hypothetical protein [Vicinamibacterales bacterium]